MVPQHPPPLAVLPSYRLAVSRCLGGVEPAEEGAQAIATRVADNVLRGTFFDDDAAIHEDDAVGRLAREHHLVGDDDHRHAVAAARSSITASTSPTSSGSSAEVTSSKSITFGSIASARAIATRCC